MCMYPNRVFFPSIYCLNCSNRNSNSLLSVNIFFQVLILHKRGIVHVHYYHIVHSPHNVLLCILCTNLQSVCTNIRLLFIAIVFMNSLLREHKDMQDERLLHAKNNRCSLARRQANKEARKAAKEHCHKQEVCNGGRRTILQARRQTAVIKCTVTSRKTVMDMEQCQQQERSSCGWTPSV